MDMELASPDFSQEARMLTWLKAQGWVVMFPEHDPFTPHYCHLGSCACTQDLVSAFRRERGTEPAVCIQARNQLYAFGSPDMSVGRESLCAIPLPAIEFTAATELQTHMPLPAVEFSAYESVNSSATKVQTLYRAHVSRKMLHKLRARKLAEDATKKVAATKIQSAFRKSAFRNLFRNQSAFRFGKQVAGLKTDLANKCAECDELMTQLAALGALQQEKNSKKRRRLRPLDVNCASPVS